MLRQLKTWEISVLDCDGRTHTREEQALDRPEALENFRDRIRWSRKKLRERLVRCVEVEDDGSVP